MKRSDVYLPPMRLVSFDEKVELLTRELLNLSSESQAAIKELIRLYHHVEEGIDKRRLLSDTPKGGGNTDNPPGDTRIAGLLFDFNRSVIRLQNRKRKQMERLNGDVWKLVESFRKRLDGIEGWQDPERVKERMVNKAEKPKNEQSVTV